MSAFSIGATLLDAMVLALLTKEDTTAIRSPRTSRNFAVSESPCIPCCGGCKNGSLTTYDRPYQGETAAITASPSPAERCWISTGKTGSL
ncbi:MAG: hypothetical protein ACLUOF_02710 [Ruminococcus sp.]